MKVRRQVRAGHIDRSKFTRCWRCGRPVKRGRCFLCECCGREHAICTRCRPKP